MAYTGRIITNTSSRPTRGNCVAANFDLRLCGGILCLAAGAGHGEEHAAGHIQQQRCGQPAEPARVAPDPEREADGGWLGRGLVVYAAAVAIPCFLSAVWVPQ